MSLGLRVKVLGFEVWGIEVKFFSLVSSRFPHLFCDSMLLGQSVECMYTQRLSETLGYNTNISMLIILVSAHPMPARNAPEPPMTDASDNVNKFADDCKTGHGSTGDKPNPCPGQAMMALIAHFLECHDFMTMRATRLDQ